MKRFVWLYILVCSVLAGAQPPDTLWTRHIGNAPDEFISASCAYGDGGFVLAGYCGFNGDEIGPQNFFVARTDADGWPFWMTEVGLADTNEFAYAVTVTANGDIVIAGKDYNYSPAVHRAHLVRLNSAGDVLWDRTYGDALATPSFCGIAELPGGDLIAAGTVFPDDVNSDAYLVRLTANGDTVWTRTFGDSTIEDLSDLAVTPEGEIMLSGRTWDEETDYNRVRLIRTDADGNLLWMRAYWSGVQILNMSGQQVTVLPNGDLAVGATCFGERMEVWLMRTDADGDSLWTRTYFFDEYSTDFGGLTAADDDGIVIACMPGAYPTHHVMLMRAEGNGDLAWQFPIDDDNYGMIITGVTEVADQCYVISGSCYNVSNQSDGLLIKTESAIIDAAPGVTLHPSSFVLSAFPNPFNPATTLSFSLPKAGAVKLTVFDVTGREVETLVNGTMSAREHHVNFDGALLPSGLYLARLEIASRSLTQKLVLLK